MERYFDKLSSHILVQLLVKLAYDYDHEAIRATVPIIKSTFKKLPSNDVQQLLFKLADEHSTGWLVGYAIVENFNNLTADIRGELLLKLADNDNDKAQGEVAYVLTKNFNELSANIRERLLIKLAAANKKLPALVSVLAQNFDNLSSSVREQLLLKLTETAENFNNLPSDIRRAFLSVLGDEKAIAKIISSIIEHHEDNISQYIRKDIMARLEEKGIR